MDGLDTPPKERQSLEIIDFLARNTDDGGQNGGQDSISPALLHTVIQAAASPRRREHQDIVHDDQPSLRRRDPTMRTRRTDRQVAIELNAAVCPNRSNSRSIWAYPQIVCILMS